MKTSDRKIAKQHIAHLRRREDYLRVKVVAAGQDANGWCIGELHALAWALEHLRPLARSKTPNVGGEAQPHTKG